MLFYLRVEVGYDRPRLIRRLDEPEECEVALADHTLFDQRLEIDDTLPEFLAEQYDRDRLDLAGLNQRQQLEHLVERAEAARKDAHGARAEQEVHLAQREIVKLEAQRRGHEAVRRLFVREHDVESEIGRAHV